MRMRLVLKEMGVGLRRNLSLTFAVVITVAISLALVGAGILIRYQVNEMKDFWYGKINVSVYLCGPTSTEATCAGHAVTEAERTAIRAKLESLPVVTQVYYESSEAAYANAKRLFRNSPDLIKNIDPAALPESFRVKLSDPKRFDVIQSAFAGQAGVQQVQTQSDVLKKLFKLLNGFQLGAFFFAVALVVAAALLIFNAIRIAAFSRRRETGIMRLVGASRLYVQLPFLLEGAVVGLIGAIGGAGILVGIKWLFVDKALRPNIASINFIGWDWVPTVLPLLAGGAVLFSVLASFVTVQRYLRI
ncbi:MAG: permease-like cell division protein FtsX [Frankiaceae bacterium]|jgi:cell division transport system permease protein